MKLPSETGPWAWEPKPGRYSGGAKQLRVGRVVVAIIAQPIGTKGQPLVWRGDMLLPGVKLREERQNVADEHEMKSRVEGAVRTWFEWIGQAKGD